MSDFFQSKFFGSWYQYLYFVLLPSFLWLLPGYFEEELSGLWLETTENQVTGKKSKAIFYFFSGAFFLLLNFGFFNEWRRWCQYTSSAKKCKKDPRPYFLFLRPFAETAGYEELVLPISDTPHPLAGVPTPQSIIGDLDKAVKDQGVSLVAIGGTLVLPPHHEVIWLECEDHAWWDNFRTLASHARAIIISPETSLGLMEELEYIKSQNLLGKTIFLMAPTPPSSSRVEYPDIERREKRWNIVRNEYSEIGLDLPNYDPKGKLFLLESNPVQTKTVTLNYEEHYKDLSPALKKIVPSHPNNACSLKQIYSRLTLTITSEKQRFFLLSTPGTDGLLHITLLGSFVCWINLTLILIYLFLPIVFWFALLAIIKTLEIFDRFRKNE